MQKRIVDTHVHIWNFERAEYLWLKGDTSILNRSYHLEELDGQRAAQGVTDGVLVQAANNFEDTDWMLEVAGKNNWIKGVVGWVPLIDPGATSKALDEKYVGEKYFKGIRHLIHDEADPRWLLQSSVIESLQTVCRHQLPYDVVGVLPEHIKTALRVAQKLPRLKMVFDHMNQPPISTREKFGIWGELMKEASKHENFYVKISGLGTAAKNVQWSEDDIKPYVEFAFEHFGTDRCFCGGDWPVSLLAGDYSRTWKTYQNVLGALLTEEEQQNVYGNNAVAFYRL
ncbi:MAG TPA: amidohydrolase family protein [Flavisolibacter sp.]|nr:amidohydrolase family protein [Flavisolibacter sp.]